MQKLVGNHVFMEQGQSLWFCEVNHSFIQQIHIKGTRCARHCPGWLGYGGKQKPALMDYILVLIRSWEKL